MGLSGICSKRVLIRPKAPEVEKNHRIPGPKVGICLISPHVVGSGPEVRASVVTK